MNINLLLLIIITFFMKRNLSFKFLFSCMLFLGVNSQAQISIGLLSGTEGLFGLRAGYHIDDNWEFGAKFTPSLNILSSQGSAGFVGGYAKYNFEEMDGMFNSSIMPYLVANFGQINPPNQSSYNTIGTTTITSTNIDYKPILGGSVGAGVEYGSSSLKYISEIGFGRMPNVFTSIGSTDPYSSTTKSADTAKAFTSFYYISFGLVYNFN